MRIAPYWKKSTFTGEVPGRGEQTFTAWGWSFQNPDEAQREAAARAQRVYNHFAQRDTRPDRYPYLDTPMREEIIESVKQGDKEIAVITRNRYGALVLNSASVMFADVDFPEAKSSGGGGGLLDMILKLLGLSSSDDAPSASDPVSATIQRVRDWAANNPGVSFRLYRTAAGLRLLFTDKLYDAKSGQTDSLLAALGSDPMYRKLTQKQESFRARLTPKPWRANCANPPNEYPWDSNSAEQEYRNWEHEYADCTRSYKTAELVEVVGGESTDEEIRKIVQLHDQYALRGGGALA